MDSQGTRVDIESGRLHGRRDVSAACLILVICKGFELLFNPKKRALAAFFVILEAISSFLDGFQKSQRIIRIVAFLLSVLGFLMTVLTGISERNSMANRVQAEKQLGAVEIGFSVVQLIATFMALLGIKIMNNYMSSILLVFFAVIAYGFTFVKDEEASDTSGVENSPSSIEVLDIASNPNEIDEQSHIASTPNEIGEHSDLANTANEMDDTEISQPLLSSSMEIFSKCLSNTDIEVRLAIPTTALPHLAPFDGNFVVVKDWTDKIWRFRLSTRRIGHPRPKFTGDWIEFAQAKRLQPGDFLIFSKLEDDLYKIEVFRKTNKMLFGQEVKWILVDLA